MPLVGEIYQVNSAVWSNQKINVPGEFQIQRKWTWYRDGIKITDGGIYTLTSADVGKSITIKETSYYVEYPTQTTTVESPPIIDISGSQDPTLVYSNNLKYLGAFRPPVLDSIQANPDNDWKGYGIAFSASGNGGKGSLFITSAGTALRIGECSIPASFGTSVDPEQLPLASLLQGTAAAGTFEPTDGSFSQYSASIPGTGQTNIRGCIVYQNNLYVDYANWNAGTQTVTHWKRNTNLTVPSSVVGPATVKSPVTRFTNPRWTTGPMAHVPADKITANYFGIDGKVMVGYMADVTTSNDYSHGPSAFVFDPAKLTGVSNISAYPILSYTKATPLQKTLDAAGNYINDHFRMFNLTSVYQGFAWPSGTNALLFMGRNGHGWFDYGPGGASGGYTGGRKIYDPADTTVGEHAYPYYYQCWAYDVRQLKAEFDKGRGNGLDSTPENLGPYAIWNFNLPYEENDPGHNLRGIAYDSKTKRLYIGQSGRSFSKLVIHVFEVNNAVIA